MPYVMNLTHYLDETGNIPKGIPAPARRMGSFLALMVDEVTRKYPQTKASIETTLRCLDKSCKGELIGALDDGTSPVCWYCLDCGEHGRISHWQNTRWDMVEAFGLDRRIENYQGKRDNEKGSDTFCGSNN